ncbi:unnamed protein product [Gongylonema pulchrum]|uniref:Uncharacterized protein n=1 Tax=Gongylonema pulchrum TaxID=637853 RepID=A0A183E226_9BILA|nr:unnamed protein product [Gongylonema pulchrum]
MEESGSALSAMQACARLSPPTYLADGLCNISFLSSLSKHAACADSVNATGERWEKPRTAKNIPSTIGDHRPKPLPGSAQRPRLLTLMPGHRR